MSDYETKQTEFEIARNEAVDIYFGVRPQLARTIERERIFEAGFRLAWEFLEKKNES